MIDIQFCNGCQMDANCPLQTQYREYGASIVNYDILESPHFMVSLACLARQDVEASASEDRYAISRADELLQQCFGSKEV